MPRMGIVGDWLSWFPLVFKSDLSEVPWPKSHSLKNTCRFGDRIAPDDTWIQDTQPALLSALSHPITRTVTQMSLLVSLLESNTVTLSRAQQGHLRLIRASSCCRCS